MPYPRAYLYLIAALGLTIFGFWPGYFSHFSEASLALHFHGVTASLWMLLLISQSWSIHHDQWPLHRLGGMATLIIAPFFIAGAPLVTKTAHLGTSPLKVMFGDPLAIASMISAIAFGGFYFAGLTLRRITPLHARFMLGTVFLLLPPVFTRILARVVADFVPILTIQGVEDLPKWARSYHLATALTIALVICFYLANRKQGWPFLIMAAVLVLQAVAFQFIAGTQWWESTIAQYATIPTPALILIGIGIGTIISGAGWALGRTSISRRTKAEPLVDA